MPRNGSGTFSLPAGYTATTGQTITAAQHNDPLEDIASDLNTARPVVAGGTGATTASGALVNLGLTATAAELNILDGVTASTAELNILDGVTASTAELNILDGVTATAGEINHLDGLTSAAVGLTDTQTLTNKTLTAPAINGSITGDVVLAEATWEAGTDTTEAVVSPAKMKAAVDAVTDAVGVRRYVSSSGHSNWEDVLVTEAHGMGVQPFFLAAYVVCTTTDGGWSVGDRIWLGQFENGNLGGHAASDATNLYWRGGTNQRFFQKGSTSNFDPVESRWELYFFALF